MRTPALFIDIANLSVIFSLLRESDNWARVVTPENQFFD